jgi:hypothetical protein
MKTINKQAAENQQAFATGVTVLAFPPIAGNVAFIDEWLFGVGAAPEFDLDLWAAGTTNLTVAELYALIPHPLVVPDDVVVPTHGTDLFTAVAHGLETGDGPLFLSSTLTLPPEIVAGTPYYVIKLDNDTFKVALSREDAFAGTFVAISGNGTGVITLSDSADTSRIWFHSTGLIGHAGDGAVGLTSRKGYTTRCLHRVAAVGYCVSATLSAAIAINFAVSPVIEN